MSIQVPSVAPSNTDINTVFQFVDPTSSGGTLVSFAERGGKLSFLVKTNGTPDSTEVSYDATQHLYWRLSESGGMLSWDTSPDGKTWTSQRAIATPTWADAGVVTFAVGAVTNTGNGASSFTDLE
jgi:hypothetical protein